MALIARRQRLARLRRHIEKLEKGERAAPAACALECGPLRLRLGALHEIRALDWRDGPAAEGLALALAGKIAAAASKPVVWIGQRHEICSAGRSYGGGLAFFGLNPYHMMFVYPRTAKETLWAAEEAVRASSVAAILIDFLRPHGLLNLTATRRLQLAAESSGATAILLRGKDDHEPSAARTKIVVSAAPSAVDPYDLKASGNPRWRVFLERCRDGGRGNWVLEWDCETGELIEAPPLHGGVASPVADRPLEETKAIA